MSFLSRNVARLALFLSNMYVYIYTHKTHMYISLYISKWNRAEILPLQ